MERIEEVIVVEGKSDTKKLQSFFDVETIETSGSRCNSETIAFIREISKRRGVIVFTDPDNPGERIRHRINQAIPGLKNAFVLKEDARTRKKVGVEHADYETLKEALVNLVTYKEETQTLSKEDYMELGLSGHEDSSTKRDKLARKFHIGHCNGKQMLKRLNMLGLTKEDIKEALE